MTVKSLTKFSNDQVFMDNLKNYCKIDQNFDNDILIMMVDSAATLIAAAISEGSNVNLYYNEPRFKIAIMKQVKEDYYERGITADSYRPELSTGIDGSINQLRSESSDEN